MSVFKYSGPFRQRPLVTADFIARQLKALDLRPISKVHIQFDPFYPQIHEFRKLILQLSSPKLRDTNGKCTFKTEVVSDLSQPQLTVKLENGKQILFKAANLTTLEILTELNNIVRPLLPPEPTEADIIPKTKSQKKRH